MLSTHDYVSDIDDEQKTRCEKIREAFKELESLIMSSPFYGSKTFSDRCIAIVKTKLEEASMYAIKSIVFESKAVK